MMPLARFVELIETHGADPARWPGESRQPAQSLLAASTQARAALAEAESLDALIARYCAPPALGIERDEPATARVLGRLEALPRQRRGLLPRLLPAALLEFDLAPAWPRFAALVGIAVLGFAVGLSDTGMALTKQSASAIIGSSNNPDSDLSLILFEPDPLSAMR
jgi:hypothetical protein